MTIKYTVKKGKHYAKFGWYRLLNFLQPSYKTYYRIKLVPGDEWKKDLTPGYPQSNKLFGFAILGITQLYSQRVCVKFYSDHYKLVHYTRKWFGKGKDSFTYTTVYYEGSRPIERGYAFKFPWYIRWLPAFKTHTFFGGKLPAPVDFHAEVTYRPIRKSCLAGLKKKRV